MFLSLCAPHAFPYPETRFPQNFGRGKKKAVEKPMVSSPGIRGMPSPDQPSACVTGRMG